MRRKRKVNATVKKPRKIRKQTKPRKGAAPKTRNHNTWTEAAYFQKIRAVLRSGFRFWNPMMVALKKAGRPSQSSNKRLKTEYQCCECKNWFPRIQVQIDHIIPCGTLSTYDDIVPFIKNLTQENPDSYQILCKPCHKIKTDAEKEKRKNAKIV